MAPRQRIVKKYGIGEWYCSLFTALNPRERSNFAKAALKPVREANQPCFFQDQSGSIKCNKKGGVCSIRNYERLPNGSAKSCNGEESRLITLCPNRFLQNDNIFSWVGRELLHNSNPVILKQVDFLKST